MKDTTGLGIAIAVHTGMDWGNVESPVLEWGTRSWGVGVEVEMGYVGVGSQWRRGDMARGWKDG